MSLQRAAANPPDEFGCAASLVQAHPSLLLPSSPGLPQYADPVTDLLDQCGVFRTRLFRESCVFHQGCYVKDLSRLGRDLHKTLILDNSPASYIFHPNNAVSSVSSDVPDDTLMNNIDVVIQVMLLSDLETKTLN